MIGNIFGHSRGAGHLVIDSMPWEWKLSFGNFATPGSGAIYRHCPLRQ